MREKIRYEGVETLRDCIETIDLDSEAYIVCANDKRDADLTFTALHGDRNEILSMLYAMLESLGTNDLIRLMSRATRELVLPHTTMGKKSDNIVVKDPEEEDVNRKAREEIFQKLVDEGDITEYQRDEIRKVIGDVS